jgi:hypothetical protein
MYPKSISIEGKKIDVFIHNDKAYLYIHNLCAIFNIDALKAEEQIKDHIIFKDHVYDNGVLVLLKAELCLSWIMTLDISAEQLMRAHNTIYTYLVELPISELMEQNEYLTGLNKILQDEVALSGLQLGLEKRKRDLFKKHG